MNAVTETVAAEPVSGVEIFVPLAKWAMLITGNYRCVQKDAARSIKEAVHSDLEASRQIYNWVCALCVAKSRCRRELGLGTAAFHHRDYCSNSHAIDALKAV